MQSCMLLQSNSYTDLIDYIHSLYGNQHGSSGFVCQNCSMLNHCGTLAALRSVSDRATVCTILQHRKLYKSL